MHSVRAARKPFLSAINRLKRLIFARKYRAFSFDKVIWSDEKIFRVIPGGKIRCWKKINESKYTARYCMPAVQKPLGVMVWAAMKRSGAICLRRCPPKVNSVEYQNILERSLRFVKPRLLPFFHKQHLYLPCCLRSTGWKFQQDGAPVHRSLSTQAYLRRRHIRLLNSGFWPPMSPDPNPIEHLWPMVTKRLNGSMTNSGLPCKRPLPLSPLPTLKTCMQACLTA